MKTILILGGYGNFGKRIAESLAYMSDVKLVIAGRNLEKAQGACASLRNLFPQLIVEPAQLDIFSEDFSQQLILINPFLVIHTSGPFQGQDYRVPKAAILANAHYIDLADDRRFVCDISTLHSEALAKNLLVVSGASSVPGLSSVIIDYFAAQFFQLDSIDMAIAPGNRAERGEATVRAILSYTGHPISVFENSQWIKKFGWMSPRKLDFGPTIGKRWLANVDVPDLELFPMRYKNIRRVNFQAGLELSVLHWTMVCMAWLAKKRIVKNWAPLVKPIVRTSNLFLNCGTDVGGMVIELIGTDHHQQPLKIQWRLTAEKGVGPYIPTLSTIILAQKLLTNQIDFRGALPCLGLYSLQDFDQWIQRWGIYHQTFIKGEELPSMNSERGI